MPAGGIHLCVAKRVCEKLNQQLSMNYLIGSIAADSWRNSESTKVQTHFMKDEEDLNYDYCNFYYKYFYHIEDDFVYGYLVHLITDSYWHNNNFITTNVSKDEYEELNKACSIIVRKAQIPKLYISDDFIHNVEELESSGIKKL